MTPIDPKQILTELDIIRRKILEQPGYEEAESLIEEAMESIDELNHQEE